MYSVKRNGDVVALFMEESDAEEFRSWKVKERWDELLEIKVLEYIVLAGGEKEDIPNDVLMMIDGAAEVEANKLYVVVEE